MPQSLSREEISYFGAGPASLPTHVLESASESLKNYNGSGMGIAEISHRSKEAGDLLRDTKQDMANYLDIPDDYDILFMQGGGSGQFSATVYNLAGIWVGKKVLQLQKENAEISKDELAERIAKTMKNEFKLDYLVTGSWSLKASQEAARLVGEEYVNIAADARTMGSTKKFGQIPAEKDWKLSKDAALVYYCDNETVDGVEFPAFPKVLESKGEDGPIVVADMSSNILSRRIPVANFSVIFFGAQKNLGTAGLTGVIIKKSLLPPAVPTPKSSLLRKLGLPIGPTVFSYDVIAKDKSLYNTLPIFDVLVAGLVIKSSLETFKDKVAGQEALANKKAALIYDALEKYPQGYRVVPHKAARSRMNICFRVTFNDDMDKSEALFLKAAEEQRLLGLKGHRSVGGMRASNYNSISLESAQKLAAFITSFGEQQSAGSKA